MFIQIIQGTCSKQDEMRALTDRWTAELAPGATGSLDPSVYVTRLYAPPEQRLPPA